MEGVGSHRRVVEDTVEGIGAALVDEDSHLTRLKGILCKGSRKQESLEIV